MMIVFSFIKSKILGFYPSNNASLYFYEDELRVDSRLNSPAHPVAVLAVLSFPKQKSLTSCISFTPTDDAKCIEKKHGVVCHEPHEVIMS